MPLVSLVGAAYTRQSYVIRALASPPVCALSQSLPSALSTIAALRHFNRDGMVYYLLLTMLPQLVLGLNALRILQSCMTLIILRA